MVDHLIQFANGNMGPGKNELLPNFSADSSTEEASSCKLQEQLYQAAEFGKQLLEENTKLHEQIDELTHEVKSAWEKVDELTQESTSAWARVDELSLSLQVKYSRVERRSVSPPVKRHSENSLQFLGNRTKTETYPQAGTAVNQEQLTNLLQENEDLRTQLKKEESKSSSLESELAELQQEFESLKNHHLDPLIKETNDLNELLKTEQQRATHLSDELSKSSIEVSEAKTASSELHWLLDAERLKTKELKNKLVEVQLEVGALNNLVKTQRGLLQSEPTRLRKHVDKQLLVRRSQSYSGDFAQHIGDEKISKLEMCLEKSHMQIQRIKNLSEDLRVLMNSVKTESNPKDKDDSGQDENLNDSQEPLHEEENPKSTTNQLRKD